MNNSINSKNLKNLGGFKERLNKGYGSGLDKDTFVKLHGFINNLTDTLFLNLANGVRIPAVITGCVYSSGGEWLYKNSPYNNLGFIQGVTSEVSGDSIDYLDITVSSPLTSKSDISSLFFVENCSVLESGDVTDDRVIFPRVGSIENDNTVRLLLECPKDTSWGVYEESGGDPVDGLSFYITGMFQTDAENEDKQFSTPGIPYHVIQNMFVNITTIRPSVYVYSDLDPSGDTVLWATKIRSRAQRWIGDCTGGSGTGSYFYSDWEPDFITGLHSSEKIYGLSPQTKYKIWIQIESKLGPNNLDWASLGCFTTKPSGEPGEGGIGIWS